MRVLGAVLNAVLVIAYPIGVWLALTRFRPRFVGLLVLAAVVPILVLRFWKADREHLVAVLRVPLVILTVLLLGVATDDSRFLLFLPVFINGALLLTFGSSLRQDVSLIERFARLQEPDLSAAKQAHCRQATVAWCVFFFLNAVTAAGMALVAPISWWAAYNGGIAYALIGVMFAGEYVVRKYRFRDYGGGLHDRLLSTLFPPEGS
ncbi:MAG: hypothetical protein AAGE52_00055 [Myxococcota bacterium]